MPKKTNRRSLDLASVPLPKADRETWLDSEPDMSALAAILSADYPLLDQPLVLALLSDYDPHKLLSKLPEIRDQLGILEASLVPDPDEYMAASTAFSDDQDALSASINSLVISHNSRPSKLASGSSELSRTASTSDSGRLGVSHTSTGATSGTEDEGDEVVDELELLEQLFPHLTASQREEAHSLEPSLPAAIDHLLSVELIKEVEIRGEWPEEVSTDEGKIENVGDLLLPNATISQAAKAASKAPRPKRKKQLKVPLVDTLQRSSPSLTPVSSRSRTSSPSRKPKPISQPSENAWGTMASLAAHLSDLIDQSAPYFLSYLHSADYFSPYSAVRASLTALPASAPKGKGGNENSRQVLEDMYGVSLGDGSLQTQNDLELCTRVAGEDVATVMDLMSLLSEISLWAGDDDLYRYDQYSKSANNSPALPALDLPIATLPVNGHDRVAERSSEVKQAVSSTPNYADTTPDLFRTEFMMRPGTKTTKLLKDRVIPGAKAAASSSSNPTAMDNFGSTSAPGSPMGKSRSNPGRQIHQLNWRHVNHEHERQKRAGELHPYATHIPSYARGALPHDATPGALYTSVQSGDLTVEECLRRAQAEREKRESSVRLAGKHFRPAGAGSKTINGSIAGTYAIRARESADAARVWELKAARMIVLGRLESTGHTIDLHNLTIMEAKEVVLEAAEKWWDREKAKFQGFNDVANVRAKTFAPSRALTVITGVGRHSAGKTGVLGPAVANALEVNGWRVDRGEKSRGYITVHGRGR